jgi:hypothetical protein
MKVEITFKPGAQMSTPGPKFEKEALVSLMVEAATVIASWTRAGEELTASSLSFPAATTTGMPSWMS